MPWYGAVYWPYAYADLFYFSFWPYAYDDGYWAYAYDDFFDGIFFPDGAPYASYAYAGPYDGVGATTRGRSGRSARASASIPGQVTESVQKLCAQPASGITAWPFERIEKAVNPTGEQQALLDDLKKAADEAAARFKEACPENVPMTPGGRLATMTERLQATLDSIKLVRPPLEKFYASLSDEQQARFNAIGPSIGKNRKQAAGGEDARADCGGDKAGITGLPIQRIEDQLNPTGDQADRLDKLGAALDKATETLAKACPDYIAQTPVGRMEAMEKRLEAMIEASNTVRPALEDFYASLDSEQKARFNRLGREGERASR